MSPSPSPSSTSSEETEEKIDKVTEFASKQPDERYDCDVFEREDEDDPRVMVERPAGSNHWYQYYYQTESINEIKLQSPATKKTPEQIEWIDKRSSRLSRISLATKMWRYIKGTDGAWQPKGTENRQQEADATAGKKKLKKSGSGSIGKKRSAASGSESEKGNAGADSDGSVPETKKSHKKSRLGPKAAPKSVPTSARTSDNGSSDDDDASDGEKEKKEAAMNALSQWFKQHSAALSLKLPGSAEAGGLEFVVAQTAAANDAKKKHQQGNNANNKDDGGDPLTRIDSNGSDHGGHKPGPSGAGAARPGPAKNASRPVQRLPPRQLSLAPLEEDDLFGGPQGGRKPGTLSNAPSLMLGSGHLSPMNSILPPGGKKESTAAAGAAAELAKLQSVGSNHPGSRIPSHMSALEAAAALKKKESVTESGDSTRAQQAQHSPHEEVKGGSGGGGGVKLKAPGAATAGPSIFKREAERNMNNNKPS